MIAIYARQSVEKKDSISIESQIEYAKREVFSEDFKIYQDSGYSGKKATICQPRGTIFFWIYMKPALSSAPIISFIPKAPRSPPEINISSCMSF